MKELQHLHILLRAEVKNPKRFDLETLHRWVEVVVRTQGLEPVIGPHVFDIRDEGNEGPTGGVHIKTSHFAFHIWETQNLIQADLYTCGTLEVQEFLDQFRFFEPTKLEYMLINRESGFQVLRRVKIENGESVIIDDGAVEGFEPEES